MNKKRKSEIEDIIGNLQNEFERLSAVAEEERDAYENLPEGLQCSERGELMSENADNLEECSNNLSDAITLLIDILDDNS